MNDLLLLASVLLGTYLCMMFFAMVLFKLFFPLKTKEEWMLEEIKRGEKLEKRTLFANKVQARHRRASFVTTVRRPGQLA